MDETLSATAVRAGCHHLRRPGWRDHVLERGCGTDLRVHRGTRRRDLLAVPVVRQDGATISVEFTIHPLLDLRAELIGIAATLRDVTARYQETRELRQRLHEQISEPTSAVEIL